jgi:hypothetical protein
MKKIFLSMAILLTLAACTTSKNTVNSMKEFSSKNKTLGDTFNNIFKRNK